MNKQQLKIYDTKQRRIVPFQTLQPGLAKVYVCGPTVYGQPHLGNARSMVVFDILVRVLQLSGEVKYVRNITDVDDKILNRARQLRVDPRKLAKKNLQHFHYCMELLHCIQPSVEPLATEHISEMIALVKKLEKQGLTYSSQRNLLFEVSKFTDYGSLTKQRKEERLAGARVKSDLRKRQEEDFVLWKPAPAGEGWDSPWGYGRPGWHLECSAMSSHYLGEEFDLHGGGVDLIFPHHENEIAQSQGCTGTCPARYWMHSEMLLFGKNKMAKSQGNIVTVIDAYCDFGGDGDVLRLFFLHTHYQKTITYSYDALQAAEKKLQLWRKVAKYAKIQSHLPEAFISALSNNLDTIAAIQLMDGWAEQVEDRASMANLHAAMEFFGLQIESPQRDKAYYARLQAANSDTELARYCSNAISSLEAKDYELANVWGELAFRQNLLTQVIVSHDEKRKFYDKYLRIFLDSTQEIIGKIKDRRRARAEKNWQEADRLRTDLTKWGLMPQDLADGSSRWQFLPLQADL